MDFVELSKIRCTTREFTNEKISKIDLDRILSVGRVAPSACNREKGFLNPDRHSVERKPISHTVMYESYNETVSV